MAASNNCNCIIDTNISTNPLYKNNKFTLKCCNDDCAFKIAMILFHNICSCQNHSIPQFIMKALRKYYKTGFSNCLEICQSFTPFQIEEFWNTLHRIGKPSYFIHIKTNNKLTPKSHNAHIYFDFNDKINSIKQTATGKQLIIDSSLLNDAIIDTKEKLKLNKINDKRKKRKNKDNNGMKLMLYNNNYKKWIDRIFVLKESFCKEYLEKQCEILCDELIIKYKIPRCYIKYSINNALIQCHDKDDIKQFLNINNNINNDINDDNDDNNSDESGESITFIGCKETIKLVERYNIKNQTMSLNSIFASLIIDLFVEENIFKLMDYSFESNINDEIIHTFQILTNKNKQWILDKKRGGCHEPKCKIFFNSFNRRHHCRGCGEIFCSKHLFYVPFKRNINYDAINNKSNNKIINDKLYKNIKDEEYVKICANCKSFYWYFVYLRPNTKRDLPYLL